MTWLGLFRGMVAVWLAGYVVVGVAMFFDGLWWLGLPLLVYGAGAAVWLSPLFVTADGSG